MQRAALLLLALRDSASTAIERYTAIASALSLTHLLPSDDRSGSVLGAPNDWREEVQDEQMGEGRGVEGKRGGGGAEAEEESAPMAVDRVAPLEDGGRDGREEQASEERAEDEEDEDEDEDEENDEDGAEGSSGDEDDVRVQGYASRQGGGEEGREEGREEGEEGEEGDSLLGSELLREELLSLLLALLARKPAMVSPGEAQAVTPPHAPALLGSFCLIWVPARQLPATAGEGGVVFVFFQACRTA